MPVPARLLGMALSGFLLLTIQGHTQTNLLPGDLAVVGVNANLSDCGEDQQDLISFVCFRDITTGTTIDLTDNGYERLNAGQWGNSEGFVSVVRTGGTIPAGTVITFRLPPLGQSDAYAAIAPDDGWSFSQQSVNTLNLNKGGDQLYFLQNGEWDDGTASPGNFSHDADYAGGTVLFAFTTTPDWIAGDDAQNSALHPDLGACYHLEAPGSTSDFMAYAGPLDDAGQLQWQRRLTDPANWNSFTDCASYPTPPSVLPLVTGDVDLSCTVCTGCDTIREKMRLTLPVTGGPFSLTYTDGTNEYQATGVENGDLHEIEVTKSIDFTVVSIADAAGCPVYSNFGPGTTVDITSSPPAAEARIEGCSQGGGTAIFDLTSIEKDVNLGTGDPVSWYEDAAGTIPVATPSAYESTPTTLYAIVGTDGCTSPAVPIQLVVLDGPGVTARVEQDVTCSGGADGSVSLQISGGEPPYRIDWSDDAFDGLPAPANVAAGTYQVTVTDTQGCSDSTTVTVGTTDPMTISCAQTQPATTAGANDGEAEITLTGGLPPYDVQWTGPASGNQVLDAAGTLAVTGLSAGSYNVEAIDQNGCPITCSFTISDPACPLTVTASVQNVSCSGLADGSIDLTIAGGTAPYTIDWDGDRLDGIEDPTGLPPGNYAVIITDAAGCTATTSTRIVAEFPRLSTTIFPGGPTCPGDCSGFGLVLEGTPPFILNYELVVDGEVRTESFQTNETEASLELCPADFGATEGTVEVRFLNLQDANCQRLVDKTEYLILLAAPVNDLDSTLCGSDSLVVNGTTYNRANPSGTEILSGAAASGCDSTVNISLRFTEGAEYHLDSTLCEGASITVNGTLYDEGRPFGREVIKNAGQNGCDSIIFINLAYQRDTVVQVEPILCRGEQFTVNGTVYDESNPSGTENLLRVSGCDSTVQVNLTFVEEVVTELDSVICDGGSVTVNGTLYNSDNPSGRELIAGGSTTGCDSVILVNLTYSGGTTELRRTLCEGDSLVVNGTTYNASNPSGTEYLPGGSIGGCDSTVLVELSFEQPVTTTIDSVLCSGESLTVGTTVYDESNPSGTENLQRQSGCDSTVIVNLSFVPAVEASLEGGGRICPGDTTMLTFRLSGAPTATIEYSDGSGQPIRLNGISDGHTIRVSPAATTTYAIDFVLVNGAACPAGVDGEVIVEVGDLQATVESSDYSGYGVSCFGAADGTLQVHASGSAAPIAIDWSTGATGDRVDQLPAGTYTVTVSDASGCEIVETVNLTQPDEILVQSRLEAPTCPGENDGAIIVEAIDGGTAPYTYRLNSGAAQPADALPIFIRDIGSTTTNEFIVTDQNGCSAVDTFTWAALSPLALELGPDTTIRRGDSVRLAPKTNFTVDSLFWAPSSGEKGPAGLTNIVAPAASTTYSLTAFDSLGCSVSDQIRITVEERSRLFAPNAFSPNGDGINDVFHLFSRASDVELYSLRVFDRWGTLIFEQEQLTPNATKGGWDGTTGGQSAGTGVYVYFAEVTYRDGTKEVVSGEVMLVR